MSLSPREATLGVKWKEFIFENVPLLRTIKAFLYWSFAPQNCLSCCWEELNAAEGFCKLLLTCRFLCNWELACTSRSCVDAVGPSAVLPALGIAATRLRAMCVINLRAHKAMQQHLWQTLWRRLDRGTRAAVVTYMGAADRHRFMLRMAEARLIEVYFCAHHRAHPITRWVSIADQLHGQPLDD